MNARKVQQLNHKAFEPFMLYANKR